MRTAAAKLALAVAYLGTGHDIRKSFDNRARFLSAKKYVPRHGRGTGTDFAVSRDRIVVFEYSEDPREPACTTREYASVRAFVKGRLDGHVRYTVRPGVATLLEQVLTSGKIDLMGYPADKVKHTAVLNDALSQIDAYVHRSIALRLIERVFFKPSAI